MNLVSDTKDAITIAALYQFAALPDAEDKRAPLKEFMRGLDVKGIIMIAESEGINGTISGTAEAVDRVICEIRSWEGFADLSVKYSQWHRHPFDKTKVKVRDWILPFPVEVDPTCIVGEYIEPKDWNDFISRDGVITVDTRNLFEVECGSFKGALNPYTQRFADMVDFTERELAGRQQQKIAMFCTGGIRCEKYSSYLRQLGFEHIYHLKGGILQYLEEIPESESLWEGECFVFDERDTVGHGVKAAA